MLQTQASTVLALRGEWFGPHVPESARAGPRLRWSFNIGSGYVIDFSRRIPTRLQNSGSPDRSSNLGQLQETYSENREKRDRNNHQCGSEDQQKIAMGRIGPVGCKGKHNQGYRKDRSKTKESQGHPPLDGAHLIPFNTAGKVPFAAITLIPRRSKRNPRVGAAPRKMLRDISPALVAEIHIRTARESACRQAPWTRRVQSGQLHADGHLA